MENEAKYLTYKGKIVFGKQSMPYFDRMPKEYSENEACFVFINRGELSVRAPEHYIDLNEKSGVLAKCLNYFFETNKKHRNASAGIEVIAILLYPSMLEEILDFDLSLSNHKINYDIKQIVINELLENFKRSITLLIDNPELADEKIIEGKLKEFVLLMTKSQIINDQSEFLSNLFSPINITFKSTVKQNLYANLALDEIARLCHMSTSSFKRKFKKVYNESPQKYISRKKIEKAALLLKSREYRISDIAYDVGFESVATFNRNFSNIFGKSPSEYRLS
ncbi:helix-turn-helix transcriptional regulator [bacterium]|nr:helix-turn-helix transcriptional regulator [bacterium]